MSSYALAFCDSLFFGSHFCTEARHPALFLVAPLRRPLSDEHYLLLSLAFFLLLGPSLEVSTAWGALSFPPTVVNASSRLRVYLHNRAGGEVRVEGYSFEGDAEEWYLRWPRWGPYGVVTYKQPGEFGKRARCYLPVCTCLLWSGSAFFLG